MNLPEQLKQLEPHFETQNSHGIVFDNQCLFAKQQLEKNKFILDTAKRNPQSLRSAILNSAAIGISLNHANAHAYLVPRDGGICLDISYRGLVKLATDSGAITVAKAVLVYEDDTFIANGPFSSPTHKYDPFKVDGNNPLNSLRGGYCEAKLADGGVIVDFMSASEIFAVRDSSKAKNGPWQGKWAGEMAKKTLVKRASKSWPQSSGIDRVNKAIEILNDHEGLQEKEFASFDHVSRISSEDVSKMDEMLAGGKSLEFFIWFDSLDVNAKTSAYNVDRPRGEKTKFKALIAAMSEEGRAMFNSIIDSINQCYSIDDTNGIIEIKDGLSIIEINAINEKLGLQESIAFMEC